MSFQEPLDFRDESMALFELVASHGDGVFEIVTQFRGWTVDDVLTHLHFWNVAADLALRDEEAFRRLYARTAEALARKQPLPPLERGYFDGLCGRALLEAWRRQVLEMTDRFAGADPKQRVSWAGPPMSVRSSISARLMESWAHGQAVYDVLGVERVDRDRIRSIAVLGVNTFAWSFANRKLEVPAVPPRVTLTAPSGATWSWNESTAMRAPARSSMKQESLGDQPARTARIRQDCDTESSIEGTATGFCQVVAQVRNVADVDLRIVGETATRWMEIAQCFAGPPRTPPPPGKRFRVQRT